MFKGENTTGDHLLVPFRSGAVAHIRHDQGLIGQRATDAGSDEVIWVAVAVIVAGPLSLFASGTTIPFA